MGDELAFDRDFTAPPGEPVQVSPLVRRIVAGNPGPFTFTGTCTYLVGRGEVAVIDPGPDDPAHLRAILSAVGRDTVSAILVTHTHRDHSPLARALRDATGAPVLGCGPHGSGAGGAREGGLDAAGDHEHRPDRPLADGEAVSGRDWTLQALATPGHAANHLAFALPQEKALFSGDHVMAWSTSVVAPPDGSMSDYMASLQRLVPRDEVVYWPGHGGPVVDPARWVRGLLVHRRQREAGILARLAAGDDMIRDMVAKLYPGLQPALHGAAALSVLAHLQDLVARGRVVAEGEPALDARYRLA